MSKPRAIYLVDLRLLQPPVTCRVPFSYFMEHSRLILKDKPKKRGVPNADSGSDRAGRETLSPPAIHIIPPTPTRWKRRGGGEVVIFLRIDSLNAENSDRLIALMHWLVTLLQFTLTPSLVVHIEDYYAITITKAVRELCSSLTAFFEMVGPRIFASNKPEISRRMLNTAYDDGPQHKGSDDKKSYRCVYEPKRIRKESRDKPLQRANVETLHPDSQKSLRSLRIHAGGPPGSTSSRKPSSCRASNVEASAMTLCTDSGNTSLLRLWYELGTSTSKFIIPYDLGSLKNKYSIGMRFKMRFEGEEAPEQRFIGTIVGIEDHDPRKWAESKWRCLKCSGMKLQRFQGLFGFHIGK
nr:auxin response factor 2-like [Ipomoea batatas]